MAHFLKAITDRFSSLLDLGTSTSKRPALSTAFSHHIAESTLSRQLGTAQNKVSELENKLSEKEKYIDKLEADRRRLADKGDETVKERQNEREEWESERVRVYILIRTLICL